MFAEVCFFDYLMVAISMLFSNDYAPRQKENLMYDVREILLRGIADKGVSTRVHSIVIIADQFIFAELTLKLRQTILIRNQNAILFCV